ncbi:MAG: hypothetical protein ACR2KK_14175 [Acidimicrobiales bacterium]
MKTSSSAPAGEPRRHLPASLGVVDQLGIRDSGGIEVVVPVGGVGELSLARSL